MKIGKYGKFMSELDLQLELDIKLLELDMKLLDLDSKQLELNLKESLLPLLYMERVLVQELNFLLDQIWVLSYS